MIHTALRVIRKYHNLTQTQLAVKLSMSTSYLSELESGKKEPSLEILQKYADFFKTPLSSLVVFSEALDDAKKINKARSFVSKRMLKVLDWVISDDSEKNESYS